MDSEGYDWLMGDLKEDVILRERSKKPRFKLTCEDESTIITETFNDYHEAEAAYYKRLKQAYETGTRS